MKILMLTISLTTRSRLGPQSGNALRMTLYYDSHHNFDDMLVVTRWRLLHIYQTERYSNIALFEKLNAIHGHRQGIPLKSVVIKVIHLMRLPSETNGLLLHICAPLGRAKMTVPAQLNWTQDYQLFHV